MRPPCMLSLRDRGAGNSSGIMTLVKKEENVAKIPQWEWKTSNLAVPCLLQTRQNLVDLASKAKR